MTVCQQSVLATEVQLIRIAPASFQEFNQQSLERKTDQLAIFIDLLVVNEYLDQPLTANCFGIKNLWLRLLSAAESSSSVHEVAEFQGVFYQLLKAYLFEVDLLIDVLGVH